MKVDRAEALSFGLELNDLDTLLIGRQCIIDEYTQEDEGFEHKRHALAKHYALALAAGEIERLKTASDILSELEAEQDGDVAGNV